MQMKLPSGVGDRHTDSPMKYSGKMQEAPETLIIVGLQTRQWGPEGNEAT